MGFTWLTSDTDTQQYPSIQLVREHRETILHAWSEAEEIAGHNDLVVLLEESEITLTVRIGARSEFLDRIKEAGADLTQEPYSKIHVPASREGQTAVWLFVNESNGGTSLMRFVRAMLSKGGSA